MDPEYVMQLVNDVRWFADVLLNLKDAFQYKGEFRRSWNVGGVCRGALGVREVEHNEMAFSKKENPPLGTCYLSSALYVQCNVCIQKKCVTFYFYFFFSFRFFRYPRRTLNKPQIAVGNVHSGAV